MYGIQSVLITAVAKSGNKLLIRGDIRNRHNRSVSLVPHHNSIRNIRTDLLGKQMFLDRKITGQKSHLLLIIYMLFEFFQKDTLIYIIPFIFRLLHLFYFFFERIDVFYQKIDILVKLCYNVKSMSIFERTRQRPHG